MTSPSCSRSSRRSRRSAAPSDGQGTGRVCYSQTEATTRKRIDRHSVPAGSDPLIARRKTAHGSGLGSQRWVVERTLSWLHQHRRLRIRYERQAGVHEAFLSLACSLICLRALRRVILLDAFSTPASAADVNRIACSTGLNTRTHGKHKSLVPRAWFRQLRVRAQRRRGTWRRVVLEGPSRAGCAARTCALRECLSAWRSWPPSHA